MMDKAARKGECVHAYGCGVDVGQVFECPD